MPYPEPERRPNLPGGSERLLAGLTSGRRERPRNPRFWAGRPRDHALP